MPLLLSTIPILAVIAGLLAGMRSARAALLGVILALIASAIAFPITAEQAFAAVGDWLPMVLEVLLIVGGGLLLADILNASGSQQALSHWIVSRTGQGVGAVLLVVHGVTPFAESLTGFGIGITIGIPLLRHLGLPAHKVAVLGLLGLCAVPWGSMGPGTLVAATMAKLSFDALGVASALVSMAPMAVVGMAAALLTSSPEQRWKSLLKGALSGLLLASSIAVFNTLFGTAPAGALGSLVMMLLWLGLGRDTSAQQQSRTPASFNDASRRALTAYAVLLLGVLAGGFLTRTLALTGAWRALTSPALWLYVAAMWFSRGLPANASLQRAWKSWTKVAPVTGWFILLGIVMAISGMATELAHSLARSGMFYLAAAPLVGALGGFLTGSNTGANAMFAATQAEIAQALGVAPLPFMAVHNVSAALFLMASPAKIEMACQLAATPEQHQWVQSRVLLIAMVALVFLAALNVAWAYGHLS